MPAAGPSFPGFVDSHTHLVFGGDRADEFEARMAGTPYAAGGIRRTVAATRAASDDELRRRLAGFVSELTAQGTTTFEVKTGYGLTVDDEARLARLAAEVTPEVTFLGAHVVPAEYADRRDEYVELVCGAMLQACAPHSRWIDVFCERGAFTPDESRRILAAGVVHGLLPRVHGNQLGLGEGVQIAVALGAASVDHCTYLEDGDIAALAGSDTVATLLPGVEFSTRQPYPDARRLIDAGVTVALASDCNPGSSFTSSMPLMIALAVREMGMTTAEARVGRDRRRGARAAPRRRRSDRARHARRPRAARCADPHPLGLSARGAAHPDGVEGRRRSLTRRTGVVADRRTTPAIRCSFCAHPRNSVAQTRPRSEIAGVMHPRRRRPGEAEPLSAGCRRSTPADPPRPGRPSRPGPR